MDLYCNKCLIPLQARVDIKNLTATTRIKLSGKKANINLISYYIEEPNIILNTLFCYNCKKEYKFNTAYGFCEITRKFAPTHDLASVEFYREDRAERIDRIVLLKELDINKVFVNIKIKSKIILTDLEWSIND